ALRLDARFLHSQTPGSDSVNGIMFSSFPAFQRCKVRPCATAIHRVDLPGTFIRDARFRHNQTSRSNSVTWTIFGSFPAFWQYMLHLYATDIHGVAQPYGLRLFLALSDSMPNPSTARRPIPNLSPGQCPAPSQLSNGVCYILIRRVFMEPFSLIE